MKRRLFTLLLALCLLASVAVAPVSAEETATDTATQPATEMVSDAKGECPCGCKYPRIEAILGRTDDMVKVKGVNIFPGQIDELLHEVEGVSSEYQVMIDHFDGKDRITLFFETEMPAEERKALGTAVQAHFKARIGVTVVPKPVSIGELPRSEKKSQRIFDNRY